MPARYLIGIDLGTTNSALAYIDLNRRTRDGRPDVQTFAMPQLVAPAETAPRSLLPSFLYLPGSHDLPAGSTALPWDRQRDFVVGEFARNQGAKVPGRLVTSAKSWLCHAGVDRSAPLLPFNAPPDVVRISPVEASARYLRHMVEAWNHVMAKERDEDRLEKLPVVLTVPASFDDMARTLTVEAARKAGLENLTLLEEPQAAFYCWLCLHTAEDAGKLKPGDRCVVVDVGGGTSDFSLIQAVEQQGDLAFVREAVGDHLLLGGDNMDLALAKFVEGKLPGAGKLDAVQYGMLTQGCRQAKEALLAPEPPAEFTVTVMGRGRSVIGGTLHAPLKASDVKQVIEEGFFPIVPRDAEPVKGPRTGLHEMGLPYVSDPAVTRHLLSFLKRQAQAQGATPGSLGRVDAILFNGGVFQPAVLRQRVVDVLRHWYDSPEHPWQPLELTNPSLDLAVAWGAAHYAWLRHTGGRRIGGGIARSYYIAVDSAEKKEDKALTVVCVVPRRLEEGQEIVLEKPLLELALGQPVTFPLYTSTALGKYKPGEGLKLLPDQLLHFPPLHTILRGGKRAGTRNVPVKLAARTTEIGTLELFCVAQEGSNRWRLEFNVRDIVREPAADEPSDAAGVTDVWPEHQVQAAKALIQSVYNDPASTSTPQELPKLLEVALEAPRADWPTGLCRRLYEFMIEVADQRRRSPAHLSRWYHLVGYCLRPGFGDALDRYRVDQLWKLLQAPPRPEAGQPAVKMQEGGADYWIMWRRIAGGLSGQLQSSLYDRLRPILLPAKGKVVVKPGANELAEMWRAAASLERLGLSNKEAMAQVLLKSLKKPPVPTYAFWSLTRLGARMLLYGPLNVVMHPKVVESILDGLLPFTPAHDSERQGWLFCLAQLARLTGQRALDVDDAPRERVLEVLRAQNAKAEWIRMVAEVVESAGDERSQMFGESLPIGLRLVDSAT